MEIAGEELVGNLDFRVTASANIYDAHTHTHANIPLYVCKKLASEYICERDCKY